MVNDYKDRMKSEAEHVVMTQFPKKIIELDELLHGPKFNIKLLSEVHAELNVPRPEPPHAENNIDQANKKRKHDLVSNSDDGIVSGTKVYVLPKGAVPSNSNIVELNETVKPLIILFVEHANLLKMWILFLIPRIEDGNNFGVSIQEETLTEIRTCESEAATYFEQLSRYYTNRGKLVSKVAKYPHVDDYRRAIDELDEKQYVSLRLILSELRNHYSTLHDMIMKNLEKIKTPRSSNHMSHIF